MRFWLLSVLLFYFIKPVVAQSVISGNIQDKASQGVPSVSITYKAIGGLVILGYVISNESGEFQLNVPVSGLDSLDLTFMHLAYLKKTIRIANKSSKYTFKLEDNTKTLKEIKVASVPVYRTGDTVNYNVSEFTSKQDRVIADIVKKLPGVEMHGNMILYQGKPIQKYMVNNLDLMGGKYGLINNNLPAEAVKNIQIVENDQPIKILNSLVPSDRASLNIQLKKFTTTGTGKVGVGYEPVLWDVNLTPMTFNKNFQTLNSFQTNNNGNDVALQLGSMSMNSGSFGLDLSEPIKTEGRSYFGLADVSSPAFDQKKWLDNRIFLYNSNVLKKLNNGLEIKGNISYYNNLNKREGYTSTSIFTPDKTVNYTETIDNSYRTNDLDAGVIINKNENNIYLNDNFKVHRKWNADRGNLLLDQDQPIIQNNNFDDFNILNKFSIARFIGKQLLSINSLIEYGTTPQTLYLSPGSFENIFNAGNHFNSLTQQVQSRNFKNENSISFTRAFKKLVFSPEIGLNYLDNQLNTQIITDVNGKKQQLGDDFVNDLNTTQTILYFKLITNYVLNKWKFNISTPYSFNVFRVKQFNDLQLNNETRNSFNPSLSVKYELTAKTDLDVNGSYSNQFGGLSNFNSAYILSSYRDIQKYNGRLLESKNFGSGISISYKNTVEASFATLSYNYTHGERDYIYRTTLDTNGLSTVELDNRPSRQDAHSVIGRASTYFQNLKTVLKINANLLFSKSDYLLNNLFTKQYAYLYGAGLDLNNSALEYLSLRYSTNFNRSISKLKGQYENSILTNNHTIDFSFYPVKNHSISVTNTYYITNSKGQENQLFIDLEYRWTIPKLKTDIEFSLFNLLNNNLYFQQYNNEYSVVQSYFQLRSRRFMVSTRFKF